MIDNSFCLDRLFQTSLDPMLDAYLLRARLNSETSSSILPNYRIDDFFLLSRFIFVKEI